MWGLDIDAELGLTDAESTHADRLVALVDMFSRVINAAPGSAYQFDKALLGTPALISVARNLATDPAAEPGKLVYGPAGPMRAEKVTAAVAIWAQQYDAGRRLWPLETTTDIPDALRRKLIGAKAADETARRALLGDDDDGN